MENRVPEGSPPVVQPINDPRLGLGFQFGSGGGSSFSLAKRGFQLTWPGAARLVPDVSMLADPFTGAEIIETFGNQTFVLVVGGTSLSTPMFSGVMSIAAQKNGGVGLGQAAALLYTLPAGAVNDIAPFASANNVTGTITTSSGTIILTADQLAAPLGNTTSFVSALYNSPFSTRWFVITFGTAYSLGTAPGWDNVTGVGTPNGLAFVTAIAP